jgi:hypothetical protein
MKSPQSNLPGIVNKQITQILFFQMQKKNNKNQKKDFSLYDEFYKPFINIV